MCLPEMDSQATSKHVELNFTKAIRSQGFFFGFETKKVSLLTF